MTQIRVQLRGSRKVFLSLSQSRRFAKDLAMFKLAQWAVCEKAQMCLLTQVVCVCESLREEEEVNCDTFG